MVSENLRILRDEGPTMLKDLPHKISINDRFTHGVRRYNPSGANGPIAYLESHDMKEVVRRVLDANPRLLQKRPATLSMEFSNHSSELESAWKDIRDEYSGMPAADVKQTVAN